MPPALKVQLCRGADTLGRDSGVVTCLGHGGRGVCGKDGEEHLVGGNGEQIEQSDR